MLRTSETFNEILMMLKKEIQHNLDEIYHGRNGAILNHFAENVKLKLYGDLENRNIKQTDRTHTPVG